MQYIFLFPAALIAFAVSAVAGGGASLILLPVIGFAVPAAQIPVTLSLGTATSTLSRCLLFRRNIRWDVVRWFVPAALPLAALGAWLLTRVSPTWVELMLGLFLIANVALLLRRDETPKGKLHAATLALVGGLAGFLSGFTGAIGVVFNNFYLRYGMTKEEIFATRGANELLLHIVKIITYATFGLLTAAAFKAGLIVATAALLATIGAKSLLGFVSEGLFRKLNYAAMAVAGLIMVVGASGTLASQYGLAVGGSLNSGGLEAQLHLPDSAIALEWRRGQQPAIEQTVSANAVPAGVREAAEDLQEADGNVNAAPTFETVHSWHGLSYEVHYGSLSRELVATD